MTNKLHQKDLIPCIVEELTDSPAAGDDTTYIGFIQPDGNADTLRNMVIMRVQYIKATGVTTIQYAEGSLYFTKTWADRASYDYRNLMERGE